MSLLIIKPGLLDTIQDFGRYGFRHLGINPTGAMDRFSMEVANILAGNNPGEAVLEMHFPAPVILFRQPTLIALAGADFSASINAEPVPSLHPLVLGRNDVLQFHKPIHGARAYLAVAGGFQADNWLNSCSTHLKLGAGGHRGRALQKEDEINFKIQFPGLVKQDGLAILPWEAVTDWGDDSSELEVIAGNEWDFLTPEARQIFASASFTITPQSDRMGYRLDHAPLTVHRHDELVSSAVGFGTIQLLPDGKLILLAADHQTTGGYPRIAHVITAHHSRLAQLGIGHRIGFRMISPELAEVRYLKQQQHLQQLRNACTFRLEKYLHERFYQL
ncbi:MAG: biotin-dependent carboxyltransferase family protein [Chitinophagaceae bacterium]